MSTRVGEYCNLGVNCNLHLSISVHAHDTNHHIHHYEMAKINSQKAKGCRLIRYAVRLEATPGSCTCVGGPAGEGRARGIVIYSFSFSL